MTIISDAQICTYTGYNNACWIYQAARRSRPQKLLYAQSVSVWMFGACVCVCSQHKQYNLPIFYMNLQQIQCDMQVRRWERMRKYLKYAQNDYIKFSRIDTVIFIAYGYARDVIRTIIWMCVCVCVGMCKCKLSVFVCHCVTQWRCANAHFMFCLL